MSLARKSVDLWALVPRNWSTAELGIALRHVRVKKLRETNRGKERTELTIEQLGVEEQLEGDEVPHNAENERGE